MFFTTPLKKGSIKILLLGSGELGKEVVIEAQRLAIETVAVDRYENAPAQLLANRAYTIDMLDKEAVLEVIERERPDYILPEVEAIAIEALFEAEKRGYTVIPNAEAVNKTMNRKNIRIFAAEELGVRTSSYLFVKSLDELLAKIRQSDKPVMVDFRADWCVSCKELEETTFTDPSARVVDRSTVCTLSTSALING